jgi:hypothetical protein
VLLKLCSLSKLEYLADKSVLKNKHFELYVDKFMLMLLLVTCYVRRAIAGYVNITLKEITFKMKDQGTVK